jgi:hypothetical protein
MSGCKLGLIRTFKKNKKTIRRKKGLILIVTTKPAILAGDGNLFISAKPTPTILDLEYTMYFAYSENLALSALASPR